MSFDFDLLVELVDGGALLGNGNLAFRYLSVANLGCCNAVMASSCAVLR